MRDIPQRSEAHLLNHGHGWASLQALLHVCSGVLILCGQLTKFALDVPH